MTPTKKPRPDMGANLDTVRAVALYDEQQRIVDTLLPIAGERGWCGEVRTALDVAYPDGSPWSDGTWRTSDGFDMYGNSFEGFDRDGYNSDGLNREGKNRNGRTPDEETRYQDALEAAVRDKFAYDSSYVVRNCRCVSCNEGRETYARDNDIVVTL